MIDTQRTGPMWPLNVATGSRFADDSFCALMPRPPICGATAHSLAVPSSEADASSVGVVWSKHTARTTSVWLRSDDLGFHGCCSSEAPLLEGEDRNTPAAGAAACEGDSGDGGDSGDSVEPARASPLGLIATTACGAAQGEAMPVRAGATESAAEEKDTVLWPRPPLVGRPASGLGCSKRGRGDGDGECVGRGFADDAAGVAEGIAGMWMDEAVVAAVGGVDDAETVEIADGVGGIDDSRGDGGEDVGGVGTSDDETFNNE